MLLSAPIMLTARRHWASLTSIAIVTLAALTITGLSGVLVGLILGISWYLFPPEYMFSFGQFMLLAVVSDPATFVYGSSFRLGLLVLMEAGLLSLLLLSRTEKTKLFSRKAVLLLASTGTVVAVASWLLAMEGPLWLAIASLVGSGGIVVYVLTQYERHHLPQPSEPTNE